MVRAMSTSSTFSNLPLRGQGHLTVVKYLMEHGADVHADDDALRWSALNGYIGVVKYLVEHGAVVRAGNDYALRWNAYFGYLA